MTAIKIFHFTALSCLTLYGALAARGLQGEARFYWMFVLVYVILWCGLTWDNLWCARLLVIPPLLGVLLTAPMVLYNFYAFLLVNPLYRDSPATIIVVAIVASWVTGPSLFVLAAYWKCRQQIFGRRPVP
ncbi:hypothetical protein IAD21_00851 [Abditibacteriota bacterium]|nr:hypothetical protein IAD21_00851 [Abditibacteriota bacterium]